MTYLRTLIAAVAYLARATGPEEQPLVGYVPPGRGLTFYSTPTKSRRAA